MLNPNASFPSQTNAPDSDYPQGSAKNVSSPGAGDGTPWVAPLLNDIWGFMQKLVAEASITPSGDPDNANDSDVFDALNQLFNQSADGSLVAKGLVQLSNSTSSTLDTLAATIGALNALRTLLTPEVVSGSSAANWCLKWGKIKVQGGTATVAANTNGTVTFGTNQSAYTGLHLGFFAVINESVATGDRSALKSSVINLSQGRIANTDNGSIAAQYISFGYDV